MYDNNAMISFSLLTNEFQRFFKESCIRVFPSVVIASLFSFLPFVDLYHASLTCKFWHRISQSKDLAVIVDGKKESWRTFNKSVDLESAFMCSDDGLLFRGCVPPIVIDHNFNYSTTRVGYDGTLQAWNGSHFAAYSGRGIHLSRCSVFSEFIWYMELPNLDKFEDPVDVALSADTLFICYPNLELEQRSLEGGDFKVTDLKDVFPPIAFERVARNEQMVYCNGKLHFVYSVTGSHSPRFLGNTNLGLVHYIVDAKTLTVESFKMIRNSGIRTWHRFLVHPDFLVFIYYEKDFTQLQKVDLRTERKSQVILDPHCAVTLWKSQVLVYHIFKESLQIWDNEFRNCRETNYFQKKSLMFKF